MNYRKLLLASCAAAAVGTASTQANAQSGGVAEPTSLAEIVVTAEKRAQNLQDVPVSVTAITSDMRDLVGITTIQDLASFTPAMTRTGSDRLSIRGAGRFTFFLGSDPGVATYADGFYSQNFSIEAYKTPLFVERTEVLRGPQGTLYGRNSMGGSLNVISKRPTKTFEGELRGVAGNYNQFRLEGSASGPITENLRYRFAATVDEQSKGFIQNVGTGGNYASYDRRYVEGQIDWDASDRLHVWARYTTSTSNDTMGLENTLVTFQSPYDYRQYNEPGSVGLNTQYNYCNTPGVPSPTTLAALGGGECLGAGGGPKINPSLGSPYTNNATAPGSSFLNDNDAFVAHIDYDLGDGLSFKYIGGYQRYSLGTSADTGNTGRTDSYVATNLGTGAMLSSLLPAIPELAAIRSALSAPTVIYPQGETRFLQRAQYYSNEINISNAADADFHWIVGLYQYHEKFAQNIFLRNPNQPELRAANIYFYGADRGGEAGRSGGLIRTNSYAVFGQADWKIASTLTATVGLRYTRDKKRGEEVFDGLYFNPIAGFSGATTLCLDAATFAPSPELPTGGCASPAQINIHGGVVDFDRLTGGLENEPLKKSWDAVTGTVGLQWQPDSDTLVYGRYSRGYKAGGFLLGNGSSQPTFLPEHVNAFEVGLKRDFGNRLRTNIAAFYNDYSNFQFALSGVNPISGLSETRAVNVNAEAYGVEAEVTWEPIENLSITANYSYLKTSITSDCAAPVAGPALGPGCFFDNGDVGATAANAQPRGTPFVLSGAPFWANRSIQFQSLRGNDLPQSPRHKIALNANYTFQLAPGDLTLSANYFWRDSTSYSVFANPVHRAKAYDTVDFRAIFRDRKDRYTVIGFVKNATNATGYTSAGSNTPVQTYLPNSGVPSGVAATYGLIWPRTYGVEVQVHFR